MVQGDHGNGEEVRSSMSETTYRSALLPRASKSGRARLVDLTPEIIQKHQKRRRKNRLAWLST